MTKHKKCKNKVSIQFTKWPKFWMTSDLQARRSTNGKLPRPQWKNLPPREYTAGFWAARAPSSQKQPDSEHLAHFLTPSDLETSWTLSGSKKWIWSILNLLTCQKRSKVSITKIANRFWTSTPARNLDPWSTAFRPTRTKFNSPIKKCLLANLT